MTHEAPVKEQMIAKIKEIISNEKFKLDAYFSAAVPPARPTRPC